MAKRAGIAGGCVPNAEDVRKFVLCDEVVCLLADHQVRVSWCILIRQTKVTQSRGVNADCAAGALSALVSETLEERLNRDELDAILKAMDAEYGPPSKAAKAWAKRVLGT